MTGVRVVRNAGVTRTLRTQVSTLVVLLGIAMTTGMGCGSKNPAGPGEPSGNTGAVKGVVVAADGVTRIGLVTVGLASGSPSTTTDAQGAYTLNGVPEGAQTLQARRGNFQTTLGVTVTKNATVTAPDAKLQPTKKLGFVSGAYDSVQNLIKQWGNSIDEVLSSNMSASSVLNQYAMLFLNCGLDLVYLDDPATTDALLAWVRAGGTLYASDQAVQYLQRMLPADFGSYDSGNQQLITANVIDNDLKTFLGKSDPKINYALDFWIGLQSASARSKVFLTGNYAYLSGNATNRPLAFAITEGAGKILYTTFHNENGATPDQVQILRFFVYFQ